MVLCIFPLNAGYIIVNLARRGKDIFTVEEIFMEEFIDN